MNLAVEVVSRPLDCSSKRFDGSSWCTKHRMPCPTTVCRILNVARLNRTGYGLRLLIPLDPLEATSFFPSRCESFFVKLVSVPGRRVFTRKVSLALPRWHHAEVETVATHYLSPFLVEFPLIQSSSVFVSFSLIDRVVKCTLLYAMA